MAQPNVITTRDRVQEMITDKGYRMLDLQNRLCFERPKRQVSAQEVVQCCQRALELLAQLAIQIDGIDSQVVKQGVLCRRVRNFMMDPDYDEPIETTADEERVQRIFCEIDESILILLDSLFGRILWYLQRVFSSGELFAFRAGELLAQLEGAHLGEQHAVVANSLESARTLALQIQAWNQDGEGLLLALGENERNFVLELGRR